MQWDLVEVQKKGGGKRQGKLRGTLHNIIIIIVVNNNNNDKIKQNKKRKKKRKKKSSKKDESARVDHEKSRSKVKKHRVTLI